MERIWGVWSSKLWLEILRSGENRNTMNDFSSSFDIAAARACASVCSTTCTAFSSSSEIPSQSESSSDSSADSSATGFKDFWAAGRGLNCASKCRRNISCTSSPEASGSPLSSLSPFEISIVRLFRFPNIEAIFGWRWKDKFLMLLYQCGEKRETRQNLKAVCKNLKNEKLRKTSITFRKCDTQQSGRMLFTALWEPLQRPTTTRNSTSIFTV
jgi:hypothetical protein